MLILRSPLLYVGLALVATAAALTLLDDDAAQPIVRARAEVVRTDEPVRGGVDPAVATAPKPERKRKPEVPTEKAAEKPDPTASELGPKRRGKTSAKTAEPTTDEVTAPHCVVSGRCVRDGQPIAGMDFVLAPQAYESARSRMLETVDQVRRLWRGEALPMPGPQGKTFDVRTLPRPSRSSRFPCADSRGHESERGCRWRLATGRAHRRASLGVLAACSRRGRRPRSARRQSPHWPG
jgi:hypothetical protein